MEPWALVASSGLAPWSRCRIDIFPEYTNSTWEVRGLHPLGCLPLRGREGVALTHSMSFPWNDFTKARFFLNQHP